MKKNKNTHLDMHPDEIRIALLRAHVTNPAVTQVEIARRCGVSRAAVNQVISGKTVSKKIMREIADAIGIDPSRIWPSAGIPFYWAKQDVSRNASKGDQEKN